VSRPFQFQNCSQLFVGTHDETLSVTMRVKQPRSFAPDNSTADTHPKLNPASWRLSAMVYQHITLRILPLLCSTPQRENDMNGRSWPSRTGFETQMALELKGACEKCEATLAQIGTAYICSYECTYCGSCAEQMNFVCPNCGGELVRRPRRKKPSNSGSI
jgi:hypothetical protein